MSVSAPHNSSSTFRLDPARVLQLLEYVGAIETMPGAVYRGCKVADGVLEFEVSYCDDALRPVQGVDLTKVLEDQRWISEGVAKGLDLLKDKLDKHGLLPDPNPKVFNLDFKEETRRMVEEQRLIAEEQRRLEAELAAQDAVIPDPLFGMEPPTEASKGVTLSTKFGRAVHQVHSHEAFSHGVRAVYDEAHEKDRGPNKEALFDAGPQARKFTDRAVVLENHNDRSPFLLPYLEAELETPDTIRNRLERFMTLLAVAPGDCEVLRAALGLWFARRAAGHHTAETVQADDQWFSLDHPRVR